MTQNAISDDIPMNDELREMPIATKYVWWAVWASGPLSPMEISSELGMWPKTVRQSLARLEESGYVDCNRDPHDGRRKLYKADATDPSLEPQ